MRPRKPKVTEEGDLFRARLDQIISMKHELVQLAGKIDWDWIDGEIAPLYSDKGRPGIETRFVVGLLLLKHIYGLSDEAVCDRWVHDPYFQHFTGEAFFQHEFPHERADLSHWRKRLGDKLELLLAESSSVKGRPQHRRAAHTRSQTGHGGHHRVLASDADQREQGRTPGIGEGSSHPMGSCRAPILFCGASRSITHPDSSLGLKARRIDPSAAPSKLGAV